MHTALLNKNCGTHLQKVLMNFWPLTIVPQQKFTFHLADEHRMHDNTRSYSVNVKSTQ